jgi:flagellar basal body-associated protein FliL
MQENKFEKQVQEKMKELLLHPSDGVWQRIEAQIKKEKRRRWIIIFLPIPLIIFLFTGYRFWHLKDTSIQIPMQQLSDKYLSPGINPTQQKVKYVTIKNKASAVNNKNLFIPTNKGKSANKNVFLEPKIKISYKKNYNKNLESNISSEIKKENFTDADDTTKKLLTGLVKKL